MHRRLSAIALAVALSAAMAGCQSPSRDALADSPQAPTPPRLGSRGQFPPGTRVFVNHRGTVVPIQEPDFHMRVARRAYAHGRYALAANEVEKVRGGVRWFEERSGGTRRKRLAEASRALHMLARELRKREVDSIRVLDGVFQDTLHVLGDSQAASFEATEQAER